MTAAGCIRALPMIVPKRQNVNSRERQNKFDPAGSHDFVDPHRGFHPRLFVSSCFAAKESAAVPIFAHFGLISAREKPRPVLCASVAEQCSSLQRVRNK